MANYDDIRHPYDEQIERLRRLRDNTPLFLESVHAQIDRNIDDLISERDERIVELAVERNRGQIVHALILAPEPEFVTT